MGWCWGGVRRRSRTEARVNHGAWVAAVERNSAPAVRGGVETKSALRIPMPFRPQRSRLKVGTFFYSRRQPTPLIPTWCSDSGPRADSYFMRGRAGLPTGTTDQRGRFKGPQGARNRQAISFLHMYYALGHRSRSATVPSFRLELGWKRGGSRGGRCGRRGSWWWPRGRRGG